MLVCPNQLIIALPVLKKLLKEDSNNYIDQLFYYGKNCKKKDSCLFTSLMKEIELYTITDTDYALKIFSYLIKDKDFALAYDAYITTEEIGDPCEDGYENITLVLEPECTTTQFIEEQFICDQFL